MIPLLLALAALLAGCTTPMRNDDIIYETKKCEAAGMRAEAVFYEMNQAVARVQCVPKDQKR